jgi:hypothetical protein
MMRNVLILIDHHRRTILDCLALFFLFGGLAAIVLALLFLYPVDGSQRVPGQDVIAASSIAVAVGGVLLGIGGTRDDHQ